MRNIFMINKSRFSNIFSKVFVLPAVTVAAIAIFSVLPVFSGNGDADYMFVLKDGSNIMGSVESETVLEDTSVATIKVRTAFGEVPIPREQIVKYFKQPSKKTEAKPSTETKSAVEVKKPEVKTAAETKPAAEDKSEKVKPEIRSETDTELKTQVESQRENIETPKVSGDKPAVKQEAEAKPAAEVKKPEVKTAAEDKSEKAKPEIKSSPDTADAKSQPLPEKEPKKNEVKPPVDEMSILENTPEKVTAGDDPALVSPPKPAKNAEAVLNMDDDKLIDMLGESKVEAPKTPALETSTEGGTSEIDSIKAKYNYKKSAPKELVPKNLNSLTDDVKLIAASRTEEDILLGGTKEAMVKLAGTTPVEVISVGDKKGDKKEKGGDNDSKKNKKKKKGAKDKKGKGGTGEVSLGTGEVGLGTGEVGLTTAEIMITDETEEVKKLGGGNLSENIVKQFKKHKAYPVDSMEGKKHLEDEINKHFKKEEPKPAEETAEVEAGKNDKKK